MSAGLLALVVAAGWATVYLVTQVLTRPALGVEATLAIGVLLSCLLILGYPSALRGPRHARRRHIASPERARASATDRGSLAAFGRDLPLRSGLTVEAARRTVRLLQPMLGGDAVAITDREQVLAFAGPGDDHHLPGTTISTTATNKVLQGARTLVIRNPSALGCPGADCPLRSAVIAPLSIADRVVGTLKVYRTDSSTPAKEAVEGMAGILSLHLELAELDRERELAATAKLDALRAQINPHFLFNTLNTITSKARTDPEEARQLLVRLSDFFRYSIRQHGHLADFGQEYFFVRTYLSIEQARFGDRLSVRYDVDPQVLGVQVPVLVIQPLVENAVKHGLSHQVGPGTVTLKARVDPLARVTSISVRDDGVGMDQATIDAVLSGGQRGEGWGVGLANISARLDSLFGERYRMDVRSRVDEGTTVELRMPLR